MKTKDYLKEQISNSIEALFSNPSFINNLRRTIALELVASLDPTEKEYQTTKINQIPSDSTNQTKSDTPTQAKPPANPKPPITQAKGTQSTLLRHCATGKTTIEALHYATHIPKEKIRATLYNKSLFIFDGWTVTLTPKGSDLAQFFLARPDLRIYPASLSENKKQEG